jgi:ClpP class serine protease
MALKIHPGRVTVMVPFYAMSGGILIALAADEIMMERYSVLGPVDPQIGGMPSGALLALIHSKPPQTIQDMTWVQAFVALQAHEQVKRFVAYLLAGKMADEQVVKAADFLTAGYVTHDTPITLAAAHTLGLNAVEGVPDKVYDLFEICTFGKCARPAVALYR